MHFDLNLDTAVTSTAVICLTIILVIGIICSTIKSRRR